MISDDLGLISRHRFKDRHISFMLRSGGDVLDDPLWTFLGKDIGGDTIKEFSCSLLPMTLRTMIVKQLLGIGILMALFGVNRNVAKRPRGVNRPHQGSQGEHR